MSYINWSDPAAQVTTHFTVHECLWLPTWKRLATEEDGLTDEVKTNLVLLCAKMEAVRSFLGNKPINVHCMFRPKEYNKLVNGATKSAHLTGEAIDFDIEGHNTITHCNDVKIKLKDHLEDFDIRMEDNVNCAWIHIDLHSPHPNRFFKP